MNRFFFVCDVYVFHNNKEKNVVWDIMMLSVDDNFDNSIAFCKENSNAKKLK